MIRSVRFCVNHAAKISKLGVSQPRLSFGKGYNVLIGPNGSGKSTTLKAIAECPLCKVNGRRDRIKYVTTETLNPLAGGTFSTREEMIQGVRAMFLSHGKGVMDSLHNQSHAGETVILIDSPETGQDFENSELIHRGLLGMSAQYQVIAATNSLVFMRAGRIIDLGNNYVQSLLRSTGKLLAQFEQGYKPEEV